MTGKACKACPLTPVSVIRELIMILYNFFAEKSAIANCHAYKEV